MLGRFMLFRLGNDVGTPRIRDLFLGCICMHLLGLRRRLMLFFFRRRSLFLLLEIVGALHICDIFTATRLRACPSGVLLCLLLLHLHIVVLSTPF